MTLQNRPGVSLMPVRPSRRVQGLARGDVPVLLGYATRGPGGVPVRLESLRQYEAVFGPPMAGVHLYDAVRGFFETGGRAAYVMRLVGQGARVASASLGAWRVRAHRPLAALGPLDPVQGMPPWLDELRRTHGSSLPDPGGWANDLTLTLTRRSRLRLSAETFVGKADRLRPASLAGLAAHVVLIVTQGARRAVARITGVDAASGEIILSRALGAPFALGAAQPVMLESVTYDAEVQARGQRLELFTDLHLAPEHPAHLAARLNRASLYVALSGPAPALTTPDDGHWADETLWPPKGRFALTRGSADLAGLGTGDWIAALEASARVDEIALIAAPDLVRQPVSRRTDLEPAAPPALTCDLPVASPRGGIAGLVLDGATGAPVAGCQVLAAGSGAFAVTDAQGRFLLRNLTLGLIDLRLSAPGYEDADLFAQSFTAAGPLTPDAAREKISLTAIDDIRSFAPDEVVAVQRAMGEGGVAGRWRIAVLDPPAPGLSPEALLSWRAQLGQDRRLFAVAPWLQVVQTEGGPLADQPPSGHVCGAFAFGELAQGVHRAPANFPLRHARQLTRDLDADTLDAFHAASLNALRALPGQGLRLMGSRSLAGDAEWQQVSVRRQFDAIAKTLETRLSWAVFEPNGPATRNVLRFCVAQFLETLRLRGMFAGTTAAEAYSVTCDGTNNTAAGAARGELLLDIGIAPTRPYEFIRFSLTAQADAIEVTEQK